LRQQTFAQPAGRSSIEGGLAALMDNAFIAKVFIAKVLTPNALIPNSTSFPIPERQ